MENLTTQSSLRSLDESGRSLTAGRSSNPTSNDTEFDGHLERARAETREDERIASKRSARQEVPSRDQRSTERKPDDEGVREESQVAQADREVGKNKSGETESEAPDEHERQAAKQSDKPDPSDELGPISLAQAVDPEAPAPTLLLGLSNPPSQGEAGSAVLPEQTQVGVTQAQSVGAAVASSATQGTEAAHKVASGTTLSVPSDAAPVAETKQAPADVTRPDVTATRAPVDSERIARAESVLNQIRLRLGNDLRSATLSLEPAELGRLRIQIEVESGSVRAELRVESREALAALERHIPELRALFASDGLELAEVRVGMAPDGAFDQANDSSSSNNSRSDGGTEDTEEAPASLGPMTTALADETGVDFLA